MVRADKGVDLDDLSIDDAKAAFYAESFKGPEHLATIQEEARAVVSAALKG